MTSKILLSKQISKASCGKLTVIGIGRLGLGFALLLERSGYNVMGVDVNAEYLEKINQKTLQSSEPHYNELINHNKNMKTTTCLKTGLDYSDTIFILVPTPNGGNDRFYDHSILSALLMRINKHAPKNKNIVIGCTVMPKYCDEIASVLLEDCENCTLSYNPEFIAQGDIVRGFENPDIILVGTTDQERIEPIMREIYGKMAKNSPRYCFMTLKEAEVTKIGINGYITTKITYANMLSDYCDNIQADKKVVLEAIGSDSRIGTKYFRAGYSYGGPCFPRDTRALERCLKIEHIPSELLNSVREYNEYHVKFQAAQILESHDFSPKTQQKIKIEGVCYKEGYKIPIIEESAKLKIACTLAKNTKVPVVIKDTREIIEEVKKEYGNLFEYEYE
jgi:nucleotide sugar dehydrogenase